MVVVLDGEPNVTVPGPDTCDQETEAIPDVASDADPTWVKVAFLGLGADPAETTGAVVSQIKVIS